MRHGGMIADFGRRIEGGSKRISVNPLRFRQVYSLKVNMALITPLSFLKSTIGVWIIKPSRLRQFWERHVSAEKELRLWIRVVRAAKWNNPADVKSTYGARVDFVKVASGNAVAVFDIANNNFRLIAAIHYDYHRVFVLRIFNHAEYDRNDWKERL